MRMEQPSGKSARIATTVRHGKGRFATCSGSPKWDLNRFKTESERRLTFLAKSIKLRAISIGLELRCHGYHATDDCG
jgi:hypothetical protein